MTEVVPRAHTARSDWPTHGGRVAKVAAAKRKPLMPWQQRAADVALEYDPETGQNRFDTVVVTVPRQAGKTNLESDVADAACLWRPRIFVRITMQDGKTADEWMREQHFPDLQGTIFDGRYKPSRRAGSHGVFWQHNGSSFTTFPPTRESLHSKQSDLVFVDEAWAHDELKGRDLKQAIRPTMNTRRNAQLWIVSTRGDDRSAYLEEYISRGRASLEIPGSRVCFIDYGIPDGVDGGDIEVIAAHHPAIGHTIGLDALRAAREEFIDPAGTLDQAGWERAYGNRATRTSEIVITDQVWSDAARPHQPIPDRAGLALDAAPDGSRWALAAGWRDGDGHGYVEIVDGGQITRETPMLVASIAAARGVPIVVDRQASAALEILDQWRSLDDRVRPGVEYLSTGQYASACATFYREIHAGMLHHTSDPDLDAAVKIAARRSIGEGLWGWGRRQSAGSIVELVAATCALRAFELLPAPRRRPVAYA